MARQNGIIKLTGNMDGLSFYKTKDGYMAKKESRISKDKIMNDPAFQRTRENGSEFGRAGKAGKVLRNSIRPLLLKAGDSRVTSRLTKEMLKVVKSDTTNKRGERNVSQGDLSILKGFEFNVHGQLNTTIYAPYTTNIDTENGEAIVNIPAFIPQESFSAPAGTTHIRMLTAVSAVNFEEESFNLGTAESNDIAIGPQTEDEFTLTASFPAGDTEPVFLLFGIEFLQEVNGMMYALNNGAYNALALVEIFEPEN